MTWSWEAESEPPDTSDTGPEEDKVPGRHQGCSDLRVGRWTHHAGGLDGFRQVSSVGLAPEDVTLELLGSAVRDHSEGVAVVADAQKGEEAHLALPDRLLPLLSTAVGGRRQAEDEPGWLALALALALAYRSPPQRQDVVADVDHAGLPLVSVGGVHDALDGSVQDLHPCTHHRLQTPSCWLP